MMPAKKESVERKKPGQLDFPPPVPPPLPVGTYSCHNAWLALPIIPSRYLAYHIKHIICTTSCDKNLAWLALTRSSESSACCFESRNLLCTRQSCSWMIFVMMRMRTRMMMRMMRQMKEKMRRMAKVTTSSASSFLPAASTSSSASLRAFSACRLPRPAQTVKHMKYEKCKKQDQNTAPVLLLNKGKSQEAS